MKDAFLIELAHRGWQYEAPSVVPHALDDLFTDVPDDLRQFLASYKTLGNADNTTWLNSAEDFVDAADSAFAWNEFERMSLAAAAGDLAWTRDVEAFWSAHVPILMSVKDRYEYVAYCSRGRHEGKYVHGAEPEFEEVRVVAASLVEFKTWLLSNTI